MCNKSLFMIICPHVSTQTLRFTLCLTLRPSPSPFHLRFNLRTSPLPFAIYTVGGALVHQYFAKFIAEDYQELLCISLHCLARNVLKFSKFEAMRTTQSPLASSQYNFAIHCNPLAIHMQSVQNKIGLVKNWIDYDSYVVMYVHCLFNTIYMVHSLELPAGRVLTFQSDNERVSRTWTEMGQ